MLTMLTEQESRGDAIVWIYLLCSVLKGIPRSRLLCILERWRGARTVNSEQWCTVLTAGPVLACVAIMTTAHCSTVAAA